MGFRFRKSIKAGPLRINFSKSGVGASVGGKFFRYTKKAGGGTRATATIPGTGLSYVKDSPSSSSMKSSRKTSHTSKFKQEYNTPGTNHKSNNVVELLLCIFLGWMGAHRFYTHRRTSAWVYLFTFGCLGIGWIGDIFIISSRFFPNLNTSAKQYVQPLAYVLAFVLIFIIGGCSSETFDAPPDPAALIETTTQTTEPETTAEATTMPSIEPSTEVATEVPTENTTEMPTEDATEAAPIATPEPDTKPSATTKQEPQIRNYVLNTSSHKFHKPSCRDVKKIKDENRSDYEGTREDLIARDYTPCGHCYP